jgi:hypothetical protein
MYVPGRRRRIQNIRQETLISVAPSTRINRPRTSVSTGSKVHRGENGKFVTLGESGTLTSLLVGPSLKKRLEHKYKYPLGKAREKSCTYKAYFAANRGPKQRKVADPLNPPL